MSLISALTDRPRLLDGLFAAAIGALSIAGSIAAGQDQTDMRTLDLTGFVLLVAGAAVLALRRGLPGLTFGVVMMLTMTYVLMRYPYGPIFLYAAVAIYSVAAWRGTRYAVITVGLAMLAHVPWSLWLEPKPDSLVFTTLTTAFWLISPLAVGIAVRTQRQSVARAALEEQHLRLYEQRLRLAQEVHDVVGHSLAVISMNAGAALHVLSKQSGPPRVADSLRAPSRVAESLRAIRAASGDALDELRAALIGLDGPGLAQLPRLIAASNVGGLAATLTVTGDRGQVPSTVDSAAYRIAQESLANVVRHAGARQVTVAVGYQRDRIALSVTDDGRGGAIAPGGSGLESMRQRARNLGGRLTAGPRTEGGFAVSAELPYDSGNP